MWHRSGICLVMYFSLYFSRSCCRGTSDSVKEQNVLEPLETLMQSTLFNVLKMVSQNMNSTGSTMLRKTRVKRQKAGSDNKEKEFADVAKIDAAKAFQIYLTALKNLWKASALGGGQPLTPKVPKPVIYDFKDKVMNYFVPAEIPLPKYPKGILYS